MTFLSSLKRTGYQLRYLFLIIGWAWILTGFLWWMAAFDQIRLGQELRSQLFLFASGGIDACIGWAHVLFFKRVSGRAR